MKRCQFQVLLLLLLVVHEGFAVPALDSSPSAATPNTIEESDKLPEGSGEAATNDAALTSTKDKVIQEPESSEASTVRPEKTIRTMTINKN